jgi:hypothetical protein
MVLDNETRGMLERVIDNAVREAEIYMKIFFDPKKKSELQIKEPNDFVLGATLGNAIQMGKLAFMTVNGRAANQEELIEIGDIIHRNIPRIRESMFKAG